MLRFTETYIEHELNICGRNTYFLSGQIQSPSLTLKLFPDIFVPANTGSLAGRARCVHAAVVVNSAPPPLLPSGTMSYLFKVTLYGS